MYTMPHGNITTDANQVPSTSEVAEQSMSFAINQITEVERSLDLIEKVSLVYLLYDDVEVAFQYSVLLINGALLNVVVEWATQAIKTNNWREKLIEALSIIQNFNVIEKLGYKKKDVWDRFLPMNSNTSLFINLRRKKLYRICETMTNNQMKTFLSHVRDDFVYKKLVYKDFPLPYIEIYFLYWQSIGYITSCDLTNISKAFKIMEMYDISDALVKTRKLSVDNKKISLHTEESAFSSLSSVRTISMQQDRVWSNNYEDKSYFMDPELPGICLIINQEHFYTEPDPEFAHLLPKSTLPFSNRDGTVFDREILKKTFEMFGYTVILQNDLTHQKVLELITETVNLIRKHSSFVLCILSHGLEGVVYGVNSIPVKISDIRNIICTTNTKHLTAKPKVIILQACQGNECQLVSDDEDNEEPEKPGPIIEVLKNYKTLPNPSTSRMQYDNVNLEMDGGSRPKTADILLFWATVPGYGAIRDPERGSWFIQSLCSHIQQRAHEMHFEDICTLVKQEVIDKRWKIRKMIRAMVPNKESTLSRFFFLPRIKVSLNS